MNTSPLPAVSGELDLMMVAGFVCPIFYIWHQGEEDLKREKSRLEDVAAKGKHFPRQKADRQPAAASGSVVMCTN